MEQGTGTVFGSNMVSIEYKPRAENVSTPGCFDINGVTVKWPSGYQASTEGTIRLCQGYRDDYHVKIPYHGNEQQRAVDIPYAVEYNRISKIQSAIKAAEKDRLVAAAITAASTGVIAINQANQSGQRPAYYPTNTLNQVSQSGGCRSDYECSSGLKCIKAPLNSTGVCLQPVNEFGTPSYPSLPNPNSVLPNYNLTGQCQFDTDCSIGFKCDTKLKACVK